MDNFLIVLQSLAHEFGFQSKELILPCRQISDCYMHLSQYSMAIHFLERSLSLVDSHQTQYAPICEQMAVLLRKQKKWQKV